MKVLVPLRGRGQDDSLLWWLAWYCAVTGREYSISKVICQCHSKSSGAYLVPDIKVQFTI